MFLCFKSRFTVDILSIILVEDFHSFILIKTTSLNIKFPLFIMNRNAHVSANVHPLHSSQATARPALTPDVSRTLFSRSCRISTSFLSKCTAVITSLLCVREMKIELISLDNEDAQRRCRYSFTSLSLSRCFPG